MKTIKILFIHAVGLLLLANIFTGCKDDKDYEYPKVTIDGVTAIDPIPVGREMTVLFNIYAPASIKSVSYSIINSSGNYEIVPVELSSGSSTAMDVPITFRAEKDMTGVKLKVVDKMNRSDEALITLTKILDKPGIIFTDDVSSVDLVVIGTQYDVSGFITADTDLTELYYTPIVMGSPLQSVVIPIGEDKLSVPFMFPVDIVGGLQKIEITAKDVVGSETKTTFTFKKIKNIAIEIDPSSSKLLIYSNPNHIKGKINSISTVTEAKYFILKDNYADEGHIITLDANNRFDFSVPVDMGITGIKIAATNSEDDDQAIWSVGVTGKLKYLDNIMLSSEGTYPESQYSVFCAYKEPHIFHADVLCNEPESLIDWWDFSCYQRVGGSPIALASPAAWGKNVQNASRIVSNSVKPGCRGTGNAAINEKVPRLSYTMISPARPELNSFFDAVETEKDLWDLLDTYIASEGKTIKEIFNPLTNSNTMVDAVAGNVHWIAWGAYNGSGKGGDKGNPADNKGLGLIRIIWESGTGPATKQVQFEIKFPEWPNYKEIYKDSYIDRP